MPLTRRASPSPGFRSTPSPKGPIHTIARKVSSQLFSIAEADRCSRDSLDSRFLPWAPLASRGAPEAGASDGGVELQGGRYHRTRSQIPGQLQVLGSTFDQSRSRFPISVVLRKVSVSSWCGFVHDLRARDFELTGSEEGKEVLITASDSLEDRYDPNVSQKVPQTGCQAD